VVDAWSTSERRRCGLTARRIRSKPTDGVLETSVTATHDAEQRAVAVALYARRAVVPKSARRRTHPIAKEHVMKKFPGLYESSASAVEMMANMTPEQSMAGMDAWMGWATKAGKALVDLRMPCGSDARVEKVSTSASDSRVAGFSILHGESKNAITALPAEPPHFMLPSNAIVVRELFPMPGL
jgi:hypothetical protein